MPKFFIKNNQVKGEYIDITGDDVNHIKNVLRLKIDDCIQVCNSDTGNNYKAQIVSVEKSNIKCSIIEKLNSTVESNVYIHILQGLPKADKMELIIHSSFCKIF